MLLGEITSTLSSWGIKIRHPPYVQYADGGNNINFIFMRDQKLRRRLRTVYVAFANNINFIAMQAQNLPPPYEQYVVIMRIKHQLYLHEGLKFASLFNQVWRG